MKEVYNGSIDFPLTAAAPAKANVMGKKISKIGIKAFYQGCSSYYNLHFYKPFNAESHLLDRKLLA